MQKGWRSPLTALALVALLAAGCSSGDEASSDAPPPGSATTTTEPPSTPADPLLIETTGGPVRGTASAVASVRNFLAIPYAEAPVGEAMFAPPVPRPAVDAEIDATKPGASCPQSTEGITAQSVKTPAPESDCLTVNVWAPDNAEGLPVMFWIHGGGLENGSASSPLYTGDHLAARGVVVISVNYRLGAFGWLALDELAAENGGVGANWGFLDQQLALKWAVDNAAAFGGDPTNVTIFGESAGGRSVCGHLASDASRKLYQRAIAMSGGGCNRTMSFEDAAAQGEKFLAELGCPDVACARTKPDEAIITAAGASGLETPLVVDGETFTGDTLQAAEAGKLSEIDVMVGANADEANLFTLGFPEPTDQGLLDLAAGYSDRPEELLALYPRDAFPTNLARFQAMTTDQRFVCPALAFVEALPDATAYHYAWVATGNPVDLGAAHGLELPPLFGHREGIIIELEDDERFQAVSEALQTAWVSFATNGDAGDAFQAYGNDGNITLIGDTVTSVNEIRDGRCAEVNKAGN